MFERVFSPAAIQAEDRGVELDSAGNFNENHRDKPNKP